MSWRLLPLLTALFARLVPLARAHALRLVLLFAGVLAPLVVFGMLAEEVAEREAFPFDRPLLDAAHRIAGPGLDAAMRLVSLVGYAWGVVPATAGVLLCLLAWRRWRAAVFFGVATLGSALLNLGAKAVFARPRPALWPSIAPELTWSFPSAHAMGSMALVAALAVLAWPTRARVPVLVLGGAFVVAVGVSRVYLGVHYPSDVLAGWAAALGWVMGTAAVLHPSSGTPEAMR